MSAAEKKAKIEELERRIFYIECADRMSDEERQMVWKLNAELRQLEREQTE